MVTDQKIRYSDHEIEEFINERKCLPADWYSKLIRPNKQKGKLTIIGEKGTEFQIIVNPDDCYPLDFSVIFQVIIPLSNQDFKLLRYNGIHGRHKNKLEKEWIEGFHIHHATERYQRIGKKEETYAKPTKRYRSYQEALLCLIKDANFVVPKLKNSQLDLFYGG